MRDIARWDVEDVAVAMSADNGQVYPFSVGASNLHFVSFSIVVPVNEIWFLKGMSVNLLFDNGNLTVSSAVCNIVHRGVTVTLPAQSTTLLAFTPAVLVQGNASLFLSGVEAQGGATIGIGLVVQNVSGGAAYNVTAGNGQVLYQPARLVSSLSLARKVDEKSQIGIS